MLFIGIMFLVKNAIDIVKAIRDDRRAEKQKEEIIEALYDCADAFTEEVIDKMEITVYEKGTIETDAEPLKFGD